MQRGGPSISPGQQRDHALLSPKVRALLRAHGGNRGVKQRAEAYWSTQGAVDAYDGADPGQAFQKFSDRGDRRGLFQQVPAPSTPPKRAFRDRSSHPRLGPTSVEHWVRWVSLFEEWMRARWNKYAPDPVGARTTHKRVGLQQDRLTNAARPADLHPPGRPSVEAT